MSAQPWAPPGPQPWPYADPTVRDLCPSETVWGQGGQSRWLGPVAHGQLCVLESLLRAQPAQGERMARKARKGQSHQGCGRTDAAPALYEELGLRPGSRHACGQQLRGGRWGTRATHVCRPARHQGPGGRRGRGRGGAVHLFHLLRGVQHGPDDHDSVQKVERDAVRRGDVLRAPARPTSSTSLRPLWTVETWLRPG